MKLEQGPFRVTLAYDGREALEVLRREADIGLVLLDLMMPYLSGLDVLRRDAARRPPQGVSRRIVLTAAGQEQQHRMAMELGASDFLTKPFSPKTLYARAAELAGVALDEPGAERVMTRWAVVLAGGVGSRFWPLSTPARPKQLLPLATERAAARATRSTRLAPLAPLERTLVLTNAASCDAIARARAGAAARERDRRAASRRHGRRAGVGGARDRRDARAPTR